MKRLALIAALLWAVVAVTAIDIDLETSHGDGLVVDSSAEAPVLIPRVTDPPLLTAAFTARGGRAAPLDSTTLLMDGQVVARLVRVDGELTGKNQELTLVLQSLSNDRVQRWIRGWVNGKPKKTALSIIAKTPKTGTEAVKLAYTRYDFNGVLIRELTVPALGAADGVFKIRALYQSSSATQNVVQHPLPAPPVRTQFFKLAFSHTDKDKKDPAGAAMAKSVYRVDSFSITRGSGLGKQDATALSVHFPASTDRSSTLPRWTAWLTQRKHNKLGGEDILKARHGKLTLFVWTGTTMDHTAGEAAVGALKPLFSFALKDITIKKLDSGEGKAELNVDSIEMSKP